MIEIKNLKVSVWEKEILKWIDLVFEPWKNYLLLWKNWSWKSTLASFLMWNPKYNKVDWEVFLDSENLLDIEVCNRSNKWIFLSFQNVPELPWVNLRDYLRTIYNNMLSQKYPETKPLTPFVFKRFIKKYLEELNIPESFLDRDLNVWFSWWEKRKIELLQAKLLNPKYIILDEIDSWLDIDAFKVVSTLVWELNNSENSIIVITHHFKISEYLNFDEVIILKDWKIDKKWWIELLKDIKDKGFE